MTKKIVIPNDEEVKQYSQGNEPSAANSEAQVAEPALTPEGAVAEGTPAQAAEATRENEYKDKYLRAVAELSNYRKRSEKEREESLKYANSVLVRALLNVLDNLDRVMTSAQEHPENTAAILDGVKLTAESFRKVLREHNVEAIPAMGQIFDPAVHEAIMQQPSEEHDTPTVLNVVQEGYKLHDRVIRPARVIVSSRKEQ